MNAAPEHKTLPLEVAARDGRARRTVVRMLAETSANWGAAEKAVNFIVRQETGLRSTERRFVTETTWRILRRWTLLQELRKRLLPEADPHTAVYFLYLVLEAELDPELAAERLAESGVSADPAAWAEARDELLAAQEAYVAFALRHGLQPWYAEKVLQAYGDEAGPLFAAMNERAPVTVRVNTARATRDEMLARLAEEGAAAEPTRWSPWGIRIAGNVNVNALPSWRAGLLDLQDEGSQLLALLTDVRAGQQVADLCAGGGGKLVAMAAMAGPAGKLVAMDADPRRLASALQRMGRLGFQRPDDIHLPRDPRQAERRLTPLRERFDRVLVDAPCSGTGAWRRHPAERWRLRPEHIETNLRKQREILNNAAPLVAPGGRLVYATCSILPEENERQAEAFLQTHPQFTPVDAAALLPHGDAFGVLGTPWFRALPHRHGTDGFFAAVFARR